MTRIRLVNSLYLQEFKKIEIGGKFLWRGFPWIKTGESTASVSDEDIGFEMNLRSTVDPGEAVNPIKNP